MFRRAALLALTAALLAAPTAAAQAPVVVAAHLERPRGLAVTPDGTLYATLIGHGGRRCNGEGCFGPSASIVRVGRDGAVTTIAGGLLSMRGRGDGFFSLRPDQLAALPDGRLATAVSAEFAGPGHIPPQVPRVLRPQVGRVLLVTPGSPLVLGPNVSSIEYRTDPDHEGPISNPYGIAALGGALYVSDSAANDLLRVLPGPVALLTTFPHAGPGAQSVPDALAAGRDGALYVGEFTGRRQTPGSARIWRVVPGQPPAVVATGLTTITALAAAPDGTLYATEFGPGDVVAIAPDGTRTRLGAGLLRNPGGIAVAPDGAVFVADRTVSQRFGRIVRLR